MQKKLHSFCLTSLITLMLLMWLGLEFFFQIWLGSYIISIGKTASKKIGALILSMKFLSPEVVLYLYKLPYSHAWNTVDMSTLMSAPGCYLELLVKLQKWICRTVGPSLAASLKLIAHHRNVASLSLFCRYYFVSCHLNWLNWFCFLILEGGLLIILIDCMIFL